MVIFVQKIIEVLSLKIDFLKNFLEEWLLNELFENVWQEIFSPKCKWCCSNNHVWMFYLVTRAFEESLCFWWNEFACNHLKVVRLNLFSGGKCPFRRSLADDVLLTLRICLSSIVDFMEKVKHMLEIWFSFFTNLSECWKNITPIETFTRNENFNLFYNMWSEKQTHPQSRQILLLKQSRSRIAGPVRIRNRWQGERADWSRWMWFEAFWLNS